MRRPFVGLCIASLVSFISARAEYSADHAARMAAARAALERKLYQLDHPPAQQSSDTILVAAASQPVKPAINPTHTITVKPATSQPSSAATSSTGATPRGTDDWTRNSRNWARHIYTEIDLGGVYQQENTTLYQNTGNPLTATFNLGVRGNVVLGYDIAKSFAVEFDTGVLWNSMNKVGGTSLDAIGQSFDTYTVPLLATVIYKIPAGRSWYPYVGVGVGGAATIASYNLGAVGNWTSSTYSDYSLVFAYQAEAGLEYKFTKNFSADVAYQFLGTTDPSWRYTISVAGGPATDYQFKEKGYYTHAFILSLTWHF